MKRILFVCTGNTCRSSMAEGIFRDLLQKAGGPLEDIEVISAGISVFQQEAANPKAIEVMKEMNIDISNHIATPLTPRLALTADLILTMTQHHKQKIIQMEPQLEGIVYTLLEFVHKLEDEEGIEEISDPFGLPIEEYRRTANEMKEALKKVVVKIGKKYFS